MLQGIRSGISKQWEVLPHRVKTAPHSPQFLLLAGRASSCAYEAALVGRFPTGPKNSWLALGWCQLAMEVKAGLNVE